MLTSMPKVTLWVSETDFHVINRAKKHLDESLSAVFIASLRQRLAESRRVKGAKHTERNRPL